MKKLLLVFLILGAVCSHAQEETASDETTPPSAEAQEPQEHWASCDEAYLNYVRRLPSAQQKKELENWWMLADRDFNSVKNDEFQYNDVKPKKDKEFIKLLAEKPGMLSVILNVKFGSYDFKKKGFPLEVRVNSGDKTFENMSDGSMGMGGIGGPPSAYVSSCTMGLDSKASERMPSMIKFKPTNLAQTKFVKVEEAQAKKLTAELGASRVKTVTVRLVPTKTILVKKNLGTLKFIDLQVASEIKEFELQAGDEKLTLKF
jgi:hypothetical protein